MPYRGPCRRFEDRDQYPDWAYQLEANSAAIQNEFGQAIDRLLGERGERTQHYNPDTGAWISKRADGWLVDRNAHLMTSNDAWQHLQVEEHCPQTFAFLKAIPGFRGECSFSKLAPHARIKMHSGESDIYYRCHLGIRVPGPLPKAGFRVGGENRSWETGKLLIFCDGYRHSAWNDYDEERIILLFNVLRPAFQLHEETFTKLYHMLLFLKTGITSNREPLLLRPSFVWLTALGVIYANFLASRRRVVAVDAHP